jgi:DNA-binding transcriptional MerR regulator
VLRQIRRYQAQGHTLAVVKRLLAAPRRSKTQALLEAVAEERGAQTLTRAELASGSGVPEPFLASLEAAGLLVPVASDDGEPRYSDTDLRLAQAGLEVLRHGFPLPDLIQLAMRHAAHVNDVTDAAIALFDRFVRKVDGDGADPEQVAGVFRSLLPAVTTMVALHFQRTLLQRALDRLRARADTEALDAAQAVIGSGSLEVRWR